MFLNSDIDSTINKNFTLLDKHNENFHYLLEETINSHQEMNIFLFNEGKYFILDNKKALTWRHCPSTIQYSDLHLFQQFQQNKQLDTPIIILNHEEQMLGYIDIPTLLEYLLSHTQKVEAYFQTILETIDASCTVIDHEKRVLVWTKGAEEIFSIKKEDILGKNITHFFDRDDLEIITTLLQGTSEYRKQHYARENLIVLINSNPVKLNNKIIGAVVSETNITNQVLLNQQFFNVTEKVIQLERKIDEFSETNNPFARIKGNSDVLKETITKVKKAASTPANILILGESGVGKELFAKAIHDLREEPEAPFVPINCGAIPATLFESELFGYEKGAFSGAHHKGKKGKIELANNGTLFLDEIGEMPMDMQVKLLRVLQEKKVFPIGSTKEIDVNFNLVAATNRDLQKLIEQGDFREDLYYRINVVSIDIPPLKKRTSDIIELVHYFLYEFSVKYNRPIHGISQEVMQALLNYSWPGNIRELRNIIERLVVFSEDGMLNIKDIPFYRDCNIGSNKEHPSSTQANTTLTKQLQHYEREIIINELRNTNGNKQLCAQNLGVSRATLYNRMNKLHIQDETF